MFNRIILSILLVKLRNYYRLNRSGSEVYCNNLHGGTCSGGALPRVTILAEWLRYFNALAVGETAAPACFVRENAEEAGMPPLLTH